MSITANNIDDTLTGWKAPCFLPSCNPGGSGTPTAHSQTIDNASPSLDGDSMYMSETGPAYTNILFTYIAGADDAALTFSNDFQIYPSANASDSTIFAQIEIDMFNFFVTDNIEYMMGTQYDLTIGKWDVWDASLGWIHTGVTVGPAAAAWTHIQQVAHRVAGDLTHVYYDYITINGVTYWYSGVIGVPLKHATRTLPLTWTSAVGIQFQVNTGSAGSGGSPISINLDQANFTASDSVSAGLILVDSSSQAWDVEIDSNEKRSSTAVAGTGPTTVPLNDQVLAVTYLLSITTKGNLIYNETTYNSTTPNSITLHDPSGNAFLLFISNGAMFTSGGASSFANARVDEVGRESTLQQNPDVRIDILGRESSLGQNPNLRIDELGRESTISQLVNVRLDLLGREVVIFIPPTTSATATLLQCFAVT